MRIFRTKVIRFSILLFVLVSVFLSSSVIFSLGLKTLKRDKISPKSQSILFGRIRLVNNIPNLFAAGNGGEFLLWDLHSKKRLDNVTFSIKEKYPLKTGSDAYDDYFYFEGEAGDYLFGYFTLNIQDVDLNTIDAHASNIYITAIDAKMFKSCSIPEGSLVYIGVIEITFKKLIWEQSKEFLDFKSNIVVNNDDFDTDIVNFKQKYPKVFEQFKDNIVKTTWKNFRTAQDDEEDEE